jgi:hypothetical protein
MKTESLQKFIIEQKVRVRVLKQLLKEEESLLKDFVKDWAKETSAEIHPKAFDARERLGRKLFNPLKNS